MSEWTVRGTVHLIEETKTFGQKGFRKRLVVLEQDKGKFINYIPLEFVQDGCDAVDELNVGDEIDFVANFHLARYTDLLLGYSRLFGGGFLERTADPNRAADAELFHLTFSQRW